MRGALIGLPPLAVAGLIFILGLLGAAGPRTLFGGVVSLFYITIFFGWIADLYVTARYKLRGVEPGRRLPRWGYFAGLFGIFVAALLLPLLGLPLDRPPELSAAFIAETVLAITALGLFLFCTSFAAEALLDVEAQCGNRKYGSLKTTLLIIYLPIGVFFLHGRIQTLLNMPDAATLEALPRSADEHGT